MVTAHARFALAVAASVVLAAWPAAGQETSATAAGVPPAVSRQVDFARDVAPILKKACVRCHARGQARGGLSLETRAALIQGGDGGPAVEIGRSGDSLLIHLVSGLDPDNVMPQKGSRLSAEQVGILRAWIDQGLPWPPAITFARSAPRNLARRAPGLPRGAAVEHPIDRLLAPYFAARAIRPGAVVDDRAFARRAWLDTIGLLPPPAELRAFVGDRSPRKRERLVERLLADRQAYAEHWLSFWNDLLRNDYRGPGYIDGGREQISEWLYASLANNLPYDRFVRQLVNPVRGAEGFTKGIVWRGVVNASQTPPMQAAQNVSQVFMGVNLKCASCHDSFIDEWQLADAYGLAGIYADGALEMVECDRPLGRTAAPRFIYPSLGEIDARAGRAQRLERLADLVTGPDNGRLSRTIVNRLWQRLLGHGLVEPVDDMEQPSWYPDLLDWLAEDLVAHGYDLKHTIARIMASHAYQGEAVDVAVGSKDFAFRGPLVRRLSAEQFADAIGQITGVWPHEPAGKFGDARAGTSGPTRASLAVATPLMLALGRPGREQVVTTRVTTPTTLQALELQNGRTLAAWLARGAAAVMAERTWTTDALVGELYQRALGRRPTARELALARERLGEAPTVDALEDVLWAVVMLPEFQVLR